MLLLLACSFNVELLYERLDNRDTQQPGGPYEHPCSFYSTVIDVYRGLLTSVYFNDLLIYSNGAAV
jgi:hypothetical protein